MCIWPDIQIEEWAEQGGIEPYEKECVNPGSIDLRWSGEYRIANPGEWGEVKKAKELIFLPDVFYLLSTLETVTMPLVAAGELCLKSSMGRLGLEHLHAGYVDCGFTGTLTLEVWVRSPWPITLQKEQRIVQLILHGMASPPRKAYQGKYNGQTSPQPAR